MFQTIKEGSLAKFAIAVAATLALASSASAEKAHSCPELQKDFAEVARACDAAAGITVSIDGSTTLTTAGPTQLFGGVIPPIGYMVQVYSNTVGGSAGACFVNDNGLAAQHVGFEVDANTGVAFVTPKGYTPLGPVSIWCSPALFVPPSNVSALIQVEARAY